MKVAWVGVGVMGRHMCSHLMAAGHKASVFSRTASKCDELVAKGAHLASSPREAAEGADIAFTMVGAPSDVESVLGDHGVLAGLKPGAILCDMTTTPSLAITVAAWAAAQGVNAIDAPVSGGDIGAGWDAVDHVRRQDRVRWCASIARAHGQKYLAHGSTGAGQHTKCE